MWFAGSVQTTCCFGVHTCQLSWIVKQEEVDEMGETFWYATSEQCKPRILCVFGGDDWRHVVSQICCTMVRTWTAIGSQVHYSFCCMWFLHTWLHITESKIINKRTSLIIVRVVEKPLTSPQELVHLHAGTIPSSCSADKRWILPRPTTLDTVDTVSTMSQAPNPRL